mgnify:CR=1 FL=1
MPYALWAPSFIDAGIWKQAVGRFQSFRRLDRNVEKYLLPEMEGYIQSISDEELISITRDFLISKNSFMPYVHIEAGFMANIK